MQHREGDVDVKPAVGFWGSSNLMLRLARTHRHEMVGGGVGGDFRGTSRGGGGGGEVTVLKICLLGSGPPLV